MPDGSDSPAVNLAGAEAAQAARAVQLALERAAETAAAGQTHERSRELASGPVQGTRAVEGSTVQGESRGARAHVLAERRKRKKKDGGAPAPGKASDPDGRGASLDVKA